MDLFTVKEIKAIGEWASNIFTDTDEIIIKKGSEDRYILVSQNNEKYTVYQLSEIMENY